MSPHRLYWHFTRANQLHMARGPSVKPLDTRYIPILGLKSLSDPAWTKFVSLETTLSSLSYTAPESSTGTCTLKLELPLDRICAAGYQV